MMQYIVCVTSPLYYSFMHVNTFIFLLQYLSANRMDTSRNRVRMIGLLWFSFFFAGVLAEGTLEKLHEGE